MNSAKYSSEHQDNSNIAIIEISMQTETTIINNNDSFSLEDIKASPKSRNMNIYPYEAPTLSKCLDNISPQRLYHSKGAIDTNPYEKFDIQQLTYSIMKDYSQLKISKDEAFMSRMQFDIYKRQIQSKRIGELVEEQQYKIPEEDKIRAFNRLIADTNRRLYVKENISFMKEKIEEEIPETPPKTYRPNEWNEIYIQRFKKYEDQKKNKQEQRKKEEESKRLIQEEEEINMVKRRKKPWEKIQNAAKTMHDQAEIRKIKLEITKCKLYEKKKNKKYGLVKTRNDIKREIINYESNEALCESPPIFDKDLQMQIKLSPTDQASNYFNSQSISRRSQIKPQDYNSNDPINEEVIVDIDSNFNCPDTIDVDERKQWFPHSNSNGQFNHNNKNKINLKPYKKKIAKINTKNQSKSHYNKNKGNNNSVNMKKNMENTNNSIIIGKSRSTSYMKANRSIINNKDNFSHIEAKLKELDDGLAIKKSYECNDIKSTSLGRHNHSSSVKSNPTTIPYQSKQTTNTDRKISNPKQNNNNSKSTGHFYTKKSKPISKKK